MATSQMAYAAKIPICKICGFHLEHTCRSVARTLSSPQATIPSHQDLATDPLWQALRKCWLLVERVKSRDKYVFEEKGWTSRDRQFLVREHTGTLQALVSLRQMDAAIAAGMHRAFTQAVYHILQRRRHPMPLEAERRRDLLEQLSVLRDMAILGSLQPATVTQAAAVIAEKIGLLQETVSQHRRPRSHPFGTACNATEAARTLVQLLLHNP